MVREHVIWPSCRQERGFYDETFCYLACNFRLMLWESSHKQTDTIVHQTVRLPAFLKARGCWICYFCSTEYYATYGLIHSTVS